MLYPVNAIPHSFCFNASFLLCLHTPSLSLSLHDFTALSSADPEQSDVKEPSHIGQQNVEQAEGCPASTLPGETHSQWPSSHQVRRHQMTPSLLSLPFSLSSPLSLSSVFFSWAMFVVIALYAIKWLQGHHPRGQLDRQPDGSLRGTLLLSQGKPKEGRIVLWVIQVLKNKTVCVSVHLFVGLLISFRAYF